MKNRTILPMKASPQAQRSEHYRWLLPEIRAIIAGLDTMPAAEIRALGELFMTAAQRRDRQHVGRSA